MWRDNLITEKPLARCPMRDILEADRDLSAEFHVARDELYPLFRRGFLFDGGGISDQNARYLAWMREIDEARLLAQLRYDKLTAEREENKPPTRSG